MVTDMKEKTKENCCGCSACVDVCPVSAISMTEDEEGFLYQHIDSEKCIDCGKCEKACGFCDDYIREGFFGIPIAYGMKLKDLESRLKSRSGGVFVGVSDYVLDQNGVVYGACMTEDFSVMHIRATTKTDRDLMRNAKYVQSNTVGLYPMVVEDLKNGNKVLFSGTPCQVSGLRSYLSCLNVSSDNLLCCDLVCHGVPSPVFWKKYLDYVERKTGKQIRTANFRDKAFGWDTHFESFVFQDNTKYVSRDYTDLFYEHLLFRPSCCNCKFANGKRVGDLTLADFWGVEKNSDSFDDNKGVSLLLINNSKGNEVFDIISSEYDLLPCDFNNCLQPTLIEPSKPSPRRDAFWQDYQSMSFERLVKTYVRPRTIKGKVKKFAKKTMYNLKIRNHP